MGDPTIGSIDLLDGSWIVNVNPGSVDIAVLPQAQLYDASDNAVGTSYQVSLNGGVLQFSVSAQPTPPTGYFYVVLMNGAGQELARTLIADPNGIPLPPPPPSVATLVAINPTDAGGYVAHILFSSSPLGLSGFTLKYGASTIPSTYHLVTRSIKHTQGEELPDEFGYMVYFNTTVAISLHQTVSVMWNFTLGESDTKAMGPLLKRPTIKAMYNDETVEELSIGITIDDHAISTPFLVHTYTAATVGGVTTYTRQPFLSSLGTGSGGNDSVAASTTHITRVSSFIFHINNFIDDTVSSISGDILKVNYVEQNINFAFVVESTDGVFRLVTPEQKITPLPNLDFIHTFESNGIRLENNIADPENAIQQYSYAMPPGRRDYSLRGYHFGNLGSFGLSGRNGDMTFDHYSSREFFYDGVIPSGENSDFLTIGLLSTDGIARRSSNIVFRYTPMDTPAVAAIAAGPTTAGSIADAAAALAGAVGPTVVNVTMDISGEGVKAFAAGVDPSKYLNKPVSVIAVTNGGTISFTEETLENIVIFPSSAELTNYTVTVSETAYAVSFDASGTMSINGSPVLLGSFFMLGNRARYVFASGSAMVEDGISPPTVTTSTTSNNVTISWIDGSSGDFVIDGYQIVVSYDGSDNTIEIPGGVSSHSISNLSNGSYGVTVSMKSGNLVGIASANRVFTISGGGSEIPLGVARELSWNSTNMNISGTTVVSAGSGEGYDRIAYADISSDTNAYWMKIKFADTQTGYCYAGFTSTMNTTAPVSQLSSKIDAGFKLDDSNIAIVVKGGEVSVPDVNTIVPTDTLEVTYDSSGFTWRVNSQVVYTLPTPPLMPNTIFRAGVAAWTAGISVNIEAGPYTEGVSPSTEHGELTINLLQMESPSTIRVHATPVTALEYSVEFPKNIAVYGTVDGMQPLWPFRDDLAVLDEGYWQTYNTYETVEEIPILSGPYRVQLYDVTTKSYSSASVNHITTTLMRSLQVSWVENGEPTSASILDGDLVSLPTSVSSVTIAATPLDTSHTITSGTGPYTVSSGMNEANIIVTYGDTTYTVVIHLFVNAQKLSFKANGTAVLGPGPNFAGVIEAVDFPSLATSISSNAFQDRLDFTSLVLPSTITEIGPYAFSGCTALASISLPAGITSLGEFCFNQCTSLTAIDLAASTITEIPNDTFYGCSALATVSLPAGITSLGENCFSGCTSLTAIDLAASTITEIPNDTFYGCTALATVSLPAGITSLGENCFSGCLSLTAIDLAASTITAIPSGAFFNCYTLASISLPAGLTSLGENCFSGCSSLTTIDLSAYAITTIGAGAYSLSEGSSVTRTVTFPNTLVTIGDSAFSNNTFTFLTLPSGLTSIGTNAFSRFSITGGVDNVTIPSSVTSFASDAFFNSSTITKAYFKGSPPTFGESYTNSFTNFYYEPSFATQWAATPAIAGITFAPRDNTVTLPPENVEALVSGPAVEGGIASAALDIAETFGPIVTRVTMDISGDGITAFAEGADASQFLNREVDIICATEGSVVSVTEESLGDIVVFPSSAALSNYTLSISGTPYVVAFDASGTLSINGNPIPLGTFFMLGNRSRYVFAKGSAIVGPGIDPPTVTTTTTSTGVTISWTDGSSGSFVIDGYQIVVSFGGSETTTNIPGGVSSHSITTLSPGSYGVRVSMKSGNHVGIASANRVFTISGGGGGGGGTFVPCFLAGAPVLTPSGYQRIETLTEGDMVMTSDGRSVAICFVKRTLVTAGPSVDPYVIPKGRFGAVRRLLISPNHKVQTDEGMVEAKDLGLRQEAQSGQFIYYNLELPSWSTDKMVVAGVIVESLAPVRRIAMPLATLKTLVAKQYGTSSAHLERVLRACRFLPNGLIEAPMLRKSHA